MTKGERVHKDSKIGGEKYDKERGTIKILSTQVGGAGS